MEYLSTKVSMYRNVTILPHLQKAETISILDWAKNTIEPNTNVFRQAKELIEQIRSEPNEQVQKDLKKELPALIPGCRIKEGSPRTHQYIENRSGWMQIDIDPKDNPDISDWGYIRDQLFNLPYFAYAGLSSRGNGMWGLVKVTDPERMHDHHECFVHRLYQAFGINTDTTKGRNPTDARFYSFDPEAKIRTTGLKIYQELPKIIHQKIIRTKHQANDQEPDPFLFATNFANKHKRIANRSNAGSGFSPGENAHAWIYSFCCALIRVGITQDQAERYIYQNILPPEKIKSNCISDAYNRKQNDFNTWTIEGSLK